MEEWEFRMLTMEEQWEPLTERGAFLMTIVYYGHRSNLYAYENVFVEVTFPYDIDGIESIAIIQGSDLDRFVNRIALSIS